MTHLKKSRSKLRKRKTIRRKTYKGGAHKYYDMAQMVLSIISPKRKFTFNEINNFASYLNEEFLNIIRSNMAGVPHLENTKGLVKHELERAGIKIPILDMYLNHFNPINTSASAPAEAFAPLLTEANLDVIGYKNSIAEQVLNILGYDLDRDFTHRDKSVDIYQIRAFAKHITDVDALNTILDREYNSHPEANRTKQKRRLLAELGKQGIRVVTDSKFNFNKMAPYLVYT